MKTPTKKKKKKLIKPTETVTVVKRDIRVTMEIPYVYFVVAQKMLEKPLRSQSGFFTHADFQRQVALIGRVTEELPDEVTVQLPEKECSWREQYLINIAFEVVRQRVLEAFRMRNPLPDGADPRQGTGEGVY